MIYTEAVQGAALAPKRVDRVHGGDVDAALIHLGVGPAFADHVLKEDLEDTTGLLVVDSSDAVDAATVGQTADARMAGLVMPWMLSRSTLR